MSIYCRHKIQGGHTTLIVVSYNSGLASKSRHIGRDKLENISTVNCNLILLRKDK
jgi:hypothetical protein